MTSQKTAVEKLPYCASSTKKHCDRIINVILENRKFGDSNQTIIIDNTFYVAHMGNRLDYKSQAISFDYI